jgi:hypothetical protein
MITLRYLVVIIGTWCLFPTCSNLSTGNGGSTEVKSSWVITALITV